MPASILILIGIGIYLFIVLFAFLSLRELLRAYAQKPKCKNCNKILTVSEIMYGCFKCKQKENQSHVKSKSVSM